MVIKSLDFYLKATALYTQIVIVTDEICCKYIDFICLGQNTELRRWEGEKIDQSKTLYSAF